MGSIKGKAPTLLLHAAAALQSGSRKRLPRGSVRWLGEAGGKGRQAVAGPWLRLWHQQAHFWHLGDHGLLLHPLALGRRHSGVDLQQQQHVSIQARVLQQWLEDLGSSAAMQQCCPVGSS